MKISLMRDPWAAAAAHIISATSIREWLDRIASIPTARYCAAIWLDDSGKPYPVQRFHGADWPHQLVSRDGFLAVRAGIEGAKLADAQWRCLSEFPGHLKHADTFIRGAVRSSLHPPPRLVAGRHHQENGPDHD